jgi:hypothetical protein
MAPVAKKRWKMQVYLFLILTKLSL